MSEQPEYPVTLKVGKKTLPLRIGAGKTIEVFNDHYICSADDIFDAGFTAEETRANEIQIIIDGVTIILKKQKE